MAVYGIGANYGRDVSSDFINQNVACIGYDEKDAPPAHDILRSIKTADLIFIKSFTPRGGLTIKAVGIVTDSHVIDIAGLGKGLSVHWQWTGKEQIGKINDRWPVRSVTIYEEHNPDVKRRIINLLLSPTQLDI